MATFNVKHGGFNRPSAVVSASNSTYWAKGRLLTLDANGQILIHNGCKVTQGAVTGYPTVGVALENRVNPTNVGPTVTLTKVGAPTGEKYSFITDEAVITTDQLESGVGFVPNQSLYISTSGKVTTSGNGTGPNSTPIGISWSDGHANDASRPLTYLFSVTY